jgi:hypothetical protein
VLDENASVTHKINSPTAKSRPMLGGGDDRSGLNKS